MNLKSIGRPLLMGILNVTPDSFSNDGEHFDTKIAIEHALSMETSFMEQTINEVSIETHYAKNAYFIKENQILSEIHKIPDVPISIIHGRQDLTCPLEASWELHQVLPSSKLVIVREGGHLAGEAPMVDALITATDLMAELIT